MYESRDRTKYSIEYAKAKLKRIPLDVQKEKYDQIKAAADAAGEKVNGYIKKAIDDRMARDNSAKNSALQQLQTSVPPAAPIDAEPPAAAPKAARQQDVPKLPLTEEAAGKIDLQRLISDVSYQLTVSDAYGMESLSVLMEKARQQEAESTEEPEPPETYGDLDGSDNGEQQEIQEKGLYQNTERQKEIAEEWRQLCNKAIEGNSY